VSTATTFLITVPREGKVCLPQEILTVARSAKRGLLLEVISDSGKPYPLLLRSNGNGSLDAIHRCLAVREGLSCKHLRTAISLAERWLNLSLPRDIRVEDRWLDDTESIAAEDLTPLLLGKRGVFGTVKK